MHAVLYDYDLHVTRGIVQKSTRVRGAYRLDGAQPVAGMVLRQTFRGISYGANGFGCANVYVRGLVVGMESICILIFTDLKRRRGCRVVFAGVVWLARLMLLVTCYRDT